MHVPGITLPALTALTAAQSIAAQQPALVCNAVQIFIARGHGEQIPGLQTVIVDEICKDRPSCGSQSIAYNATSGPSTLCVDQYAGILRGWADISEYAAQCPEAKLVLTGWSRGGALVSDLLAGGGGIPLAGDLCEQPVTPALDPDVFPGNRIAAVLNFGVLHHNANQTYNIGSGSSSTGQHPRTPAMLQLLSRWSEKFRDYCVAGDPLCAQGGDSGSHRDYFTREEWRKLAAEFVASRLE